MYVKSFDLFLYRNDQFGRDGPRVCMRPSLILLQHDFNRAAQPKHTSTKYACQKYSNPPIPVNYQPSHRCDLRPPGGVTEQSTIFACQK